MARTANSARKQVLKKPAAKGKAAVTKNEVEKMVDQVLEEKKNLSQKTTTPTSSLSNKRPAKSLSVATPKINQKPKPTATKKISKNVLREIKYYQNNIGFLIPRATIVRTIRSLTSDITSNLKPHPQENLRFTSISLDIIHEALENHLVCLVELAYMAAKHAKRVTLFESDIRLICRIRDVK